MPRRKPASAKQKKAQLQAHRAVKRGDGPVDGDLAQPDDGSRAPSNTPYVPPSKAHLSRSALVHRPAAALHAQRTSRALTSTFGQVDRAFVERAKRASEEEVLERPVVRGVARWMGEGGWGGREADTHSDALGPAASASCGTTSTTSDRSAILGTLSSRLSVPRRPRWRRRLGAEGITKKELERNEAGAFAVWEAGTRGVLDEWGEVVQGWAAEDALKAEQDGEDGEETRTTASHLARPPTPTPLHVPTTHETNLEVYRQLWRVSERSEVLLALADVRCPPTGFSTAVRGWLREVVYGREGAEGAEGERHRKRGEDKGDRSRGRGGASPVPSAGGTAAPLGGTGKRVVLVLTKTDLVSAACRDGWVRWCRAWWRGDGRGVGGGGEGQGAADDIDVVCVESYDTVALNEGPRHQHKHIPHIPPVSLAELVGALERAHASLVAERRGVRRHVAWGRLLRGEGAKPSEGGAQEDVRRGEEGGRDGREPDYVTVGLIGQPNVGKSSLLNALVGQTKVKASKTPGKTKHFQTIFWNNEVRIVDCPGLVVPALVGFDMQVMAGVLQISQIPSLPACISHVARLMPLEQILRLPPPAKWAEDEQARRDVESKKTYRRTDGQGPLDAGMATASAEEMGREIAGEWTPYLIMEGWALDRGFLTAKAGRPDVNRAGNAIMRMVAEGRIPWAFWAPDTPDADLEGQHGRGVWTGGDVAVDTTDIAAAAEDQEDSEIDDDDAQGDSSESKQTASSSEEVSDSRPVNATSRFAALELDDGDDAENAATSGSSDT